MSAKSLRVLYSKCSHKQNCSILASTNTFNDPCPGTHKYLEAHYQCVSGKHIISSNNISYTLVHFPFIAQNYLPTLHVYPQNVHVIAFVFVFVYAHFQIY